MGDFGTPCLLCEGNIRLADRIYGFKLQRFPPRARYESRKKITGALGVSWEKMVGAIGIYKGLHHEWKPKVERVLGWSR